MTTPVKPSQNQPSAHQGVATTQAAPLGHGDPLSSIGPAQNTLSNKSQRHKIEMGKARNIKPPSRALRNNDAQIKEAPPANQDPIPSGTAQTWVDYFISCFFQIIEFFASLFAHKS